MAQVSEMIQQSREVVTKPSVASFERYETSGTMQDALIYVAIAAAISGLLGLGGGIGGLISGIVTTLLGFFIFTYLIFWIGKQQGGTGSLDEVAYTFSLFWVPL
ncbi:MAG: YIP1 family protein, partial [Trueperaceae bacterium]|nr:YIP1 family protein [Trueperaceae bacterium]